MATSGLMSTSNQYVKYYIECIQNSQNIENNTSNVTVRVWAKRINTGYSTYGNGTVYCRIDGQLHSASISASQKITSTPIVLYSENFIVGHNGDGTKTLPISAWFNIPSIVSSNEQSYSQALTTIPRTSSISFSAGSVVADSNITVNINRASDSFLHTVFFSIGGVKNRVIAKSVATAYTYKIPITDCNQITNGTSAIATITVDTYSGNTYIGTTSKNFTVTVPSNIVPSFSSLTIATIDNDVNPEWGIYVKGKSKVRLNISEPSGSYGSTISKYSISGGGYSSSGSSMDTGTLNTVGENTFTATITDTRGRTATKTLSIEVVDYGVPAIHSISVSRCLETGELNEEGTFVKANVSYSTYSLGGNNVTHALFSYKKVGESSWIGTGDKVFPGVDYIVCDGKLSPDNSYDFRVEIYDHFSSLIRTVLINTASVVMDFKYGGKGIGIGKVAEVDNLLDIALDVKFRGSATFNDNSYAITSKNIKNFTSTNSKRDFTNGTLIRTSLNDQNSMPIFLTVKGNSYGGGQPFQMVAQGYAYNNTFINTSAVMLTGNSNFSEIKAFGYQGKLCFWLPRHSYWQGFEVTCTSPTSGSEPTNFVTSVDDVAMPGGVTRLVTIPIAVTANSTNYTPILHRGSNSNGEYVRYADGTQICYKNITITGVTISTGWGSFYETANPAQFGMWAASFLSGTEPIVNANTTRSLGVVIPNIFSITTSSVGGAYLTRPNVANNTTVKISIIGIGRWK